MTPDKQEVRSLIKEETREDEKEPLTIAIEQDNLRRKGKHRFTEKTEPQAQLKHTS
jgi:hypothetical protein